jgi:opacity protein-like surface antigen
VVKKALSGLAFLAAFQSASASAADIEVPPPQPPAFAWTGCYVGGHFGGSGGRNEVSDSSGRLTAGPATASAPEEEDEDSEKEGPAADGGKSRGKAASDSSGHLTAVGVSSVSANTGGFLPGGQIGCDYQAPGNWVFGVQGSLSAYTLKGVTEFPDGSEFTVKANWLASATGRIGYAWNPWLLYATGGVAWVRDSYEISGGEFNFTAGGTRTGWTVGLGIEYAFWGNWSADLQYRHYDFGSKNLVFTDSFSGVTTVANTKQWIDAVTLGLNYHLTSGSWQPASASAEEEEEDSQKETIAINGGITYTTPYSLYGNFAMLAAPWGLDNSGLRIRLATVDGAFSFLQHTNFGPRIFGNSEEGVGMVGYQFVQGSTTLLLMTGVNYLTSSSSMPQDPSNPVPGTAFGSKSLIELYSSPTDKTMVEVEGTYSTAFGEYYEDFKIGYAAFGPEIYIGPEATFLGSESYNQYRLGAFLSGIKIGKVEFGFSGGYLKDRAQGSGYFVGTDFYVRF